MEFALSQAVASGGAFEQRPSECGQERLRYMLIGYARVSKADGSQSLDLQCDALRAEGIDDAANLYQDFASGVRDDRPGLDSCLRALRKGDGLVVPAIQPRLERWCREPSESGRSQN